MDDQDSEDFYSCKSFVVCTPWLHTGGQLLSLEIHNYITFVLFLTYMPYRCKVLIFLVTNERLPVNIPIIYVHTINILTLDVFVISSVKEITASPPRLG